MCKFTDILFSDLCTTGLTRMREYDVFGSLDLFPGVPGDNQGSVLELCFYLHGVRFACNTELDMLTCLSKNECANTLLLYSV